MKKTLLLILTLTTTFISAQEFEKGYFINDNGDKTECFIKNMDWKNNPTSFKYKIQESNSEILEKTITTVKEFQIDLKSKFVRESVKIDQSSVNDYRLDNKYLPDFKEATVFLKVLVEGKSNLYYYEDANTEKFFFSVVNKVEPLIYKKYIIDNGDGNILQNETFKRQLNSSFKCNNDESKILKLKYNGDALIKYFMETNNCLTGNTSSAKSVSEVKKFEVNTKINLSLNNQNANFEILYGNITGIHKFDSKISVGFGFETEIVLPYGNKNWSLIFDPSISFYKGEYHIYNPNFVNPNYTLKTDVNIIRIPLGIRRNIRINDNNKIFVNSSFTLNVSNTKIDFDRERGKTNNNNNNNITSLGATVGFGYQFHKISA